MNIFCLTYLVVCVGTQSLKDRNGLSSLRSAWGAHNSPTVIHCLRCVPPLWPLWSLGSCTPMPCGRCTQHYWDGRGSISVHKQQFGRWEWLVPSVFILGEGGSRICMSVSGTQDVWQRRKSFLWLGWLRSYWDGILKLVLLLLLLFCYSQIPVCLCFWLSSLSEVIKLILTSCGQSM